MDRITVRIRLTIRLKIRLTIKVTIKVSRGLYDHDCGMGTWALETIATIPLVASSAPW